MNILIYKYFKDFYFLFQVSKITLWNVGPQPSTEPLHQYGPHTGTLPPSCLRSRRPWPLRVHYIWYISPAIIMIKIWRNLYWKKNTRKATRHFIAQKWYPTKIIADARRKSWQTKYSMSVFFVYNILLLYVQYPPI